MSTGFYDREEVSRKLDLDPATYSRGQKAFPLRWPKYYLDLVVGDPEKDPIARLGRPDDAEWTEDPDAIPDPVADRNQRPVPFLVQKHADRVIILTTKACHFYCRFCFRREESHAEAGVPGVEDWQRMINYLRCNPQIKEAILSGGDPLTLSDARLFAVKQQLETVPSLRSWRIHTRAPVHFPERVTPSLVQGLTGGPLALRVVTHFNHPQELTEESRRVAELFRTAGIPLLNQAVLLRGVNDDLEIQKALWRGMTHLGIGPHYLHHPDRVLGNARFRLSIREGAALYRQMQACLHPLPNYVIDLPDGRGKVPVLGLEEFEAGTYRIVHADGTVSHYRDIRAP